jgi:hypothetical protein
VNVGRNYNGPKVLGLYFGTIREGLGPFEETDKQNKKIIITIIQELPLCTAMSKGSKKHGYMLGSL